MFLCALYNKLGHLGTPLKSLLKSIMLSCNIAVTKLL